MKNTKTSEALRAARKARLAGTDPQGPATPTAQSNAALKNKKAENEVMVVQTDDQQQLPESKAEKSVPVQVAPAAPAAPGAVMAPGGEGGAPAAELPPPPADASAPAAELEVKLEAPADGGLPESETTEQATEEAKEEKEENLEEDEMELEAAVIDPALLPADAAITTIGPFNVEKDAHWVVLANGEPVAKIALSDQDFAEAKTPAFRKAFVSDEYGKAFTSAARKKSLQQLLASTFARTYVASISSSVAYKELAAKAEAKAKLEIQKKATKFRDDFLSMMGLVNEAQRTNFVVENPLKEAFFKGLKRAGVNDPNQIIEAAFTEAGAAHFEVMANRAMKWMDYSADALADIREAVTASATSVRPRTYDAIQVQASVQAPPAPRQAPVPTAAANVPFAPTFTASQQEKTEHDRVRETFGFRRRMHGRTATPKG